MFARKNVRQFQKRNAPVAAVQFDERQLLTGAVVDSGWLAVVEHRGTSTRTILYVVGQNPAMKVQPRSVPNAALRHKQLHKSARKKTQNDSLPDG